MPILNVSQNQSTLVNQIQINLSQNLIRNMNQVVTRYCLYLKGLDGMEDKYKPIVYTKKTEDEDISEKFIKRVRKLTHMIYQTYYSSPKPLKLTPQEQKDFQSEKCVIFVNKI